MKNRHLPLRARICIMLLLACTSAQLPAQSQDQRPNIIMILIDDMGWTDLSCFGSTYYETPNIDALCKAGMKFTNGYAACTVCSPTRASLMTGRYPARLHITDWIPGRTPPGTEMKIPDWQKYLDAGQLTIAEALKPAGYISASIGKWHLGPEDCWPEHQGFDLNFGGSHHGSHTTMFSPFKEMNLPEMEKGEYLTDVLTGRAEQFIEANKSRPFFLYLAHYAVHSPIQAKPELVKKYKAKKPSTQHHNPAYAAMIESVDESVGRIMAKLRATGLERNTIVIFYSDNGGVEKTTSNAPLREGKATAYEGGLRVPLIIKWPGVTKPGSVCDVPVTSPDFFPTLLEAGGLPYEWDFIDGESLVPLLRGGAELKRNEIYWHYPHYNAHGPVNPTKPFGAIRSGDYKLIEFYVEQRVALYNLREDISETKDLSKEKPDLAAKLLLNLHNWRQSVGAQMPAFDWANYNEHDYNEWLRIWHTPGKEGKSWDDENRKWVGKDPGAKAGERK